MSKKVLAWILAVLATYIAAASLVSQFNLASLQALGLEISGAQRLGAAWHDITHMYDLYLPVIAIALLIALPLARWLYRRANKGIFLFPLAGFAALLTIHAALFMAFGMSPIAATREFPGLLAQGLAGAMGGALYYLLGERDRA